MKYLLVRQPGHQNHQTQLYGFRIKISKHAIQPLLSGIIRDSENQYDMKYLIAEKKFLIRNKACSQFAFSLLIFEKVQSGDILSNMDNGCGLIITLLQVIRKLPYTNSQSAIYRQ